MRALDNHQIRPASRSMGTRTEGSRAFVRGAGIEHHSGSLETVSFMRLAMTMLSILPSAPAAVSGCPSMKAGISLAPLVPIPRESQAI